MSLSEIAQTQGKLWGAKARDWSEFQEGLLEPLWRGALDGTRVTSGTRLLDAGCGAGGASVIARQRGAVVTGCDASEGMLAVARKRLPGVDLRLAELENLPFPDASFDAVIAANSIQFAPNPARAAQELLRVTAPGGRIGIVVWASDHCDQPRIIAGLIALFPEPPKGSGILELSRPGEVEALFPGFSLDTGTIDTPWVYPTLDIALRGQMSAGATQRVVGMFGHEKVEAAMRAAMEPFVTASGEVRMSNRFRCAIVTRSL